MLPHHLFKQCRERSGLSQNRLSIAAGYDHSYVSRIEGGSRTPTPEALNDFVLAMGIEEEDEAYELFDAYGYVTSRHILASPMLFEIHERLQTEEGFERALRAVIGG